MGQGVYMSFEHMLVTSPTAFPRLCQVKFSICKAFLFHLVSTLTNYLMANTVKSSLGKEQPKDRVYL